MQLAIIPDLALPSVLESRQHKVFTAALCSPLWQVQWDISGCIIHYTYQHNTDCQAQPLIIRVLGVGIRQGPIYGLGIFHTAVNSMYMFTSSTTYNIQQISILPHTCNIQYSDSLCNLCKTTNPCIIKELGQVLEKVLYYGLSIFHTIVYNSELSVHVHFLYHIQGPAVFNYVMLNYILFNLHKRC